MGVSIKEVNGKVVINANIKSYPYDRVDKKLFDKIVRHYQYILMPQKSVDYLKPTRGNIDQILGHMWLRLLKKEGYNGSMEQINTQIERLHDTERKHKTSMAKFMFILNTPYRLKQAELKRNK